MALRHFKIGGKRQYRQQQLQQLREEDEYARLMPVQFKPDVELQPGQKLCLGILQEAQSCLMGYSSDMPDGSGWEAFWKKRYRSMKEAEDWIQDDCQNGQYWFSFRRCCEVLGYDPEAIRYALFFQRKVNPRLQHYIVRERWTVEAEEWHAKTGDTNEYQPLDAAGS